MAIYPLITGPCPYQDRLAEIMDGDMCRMCKREVHDLTEMSDAGRRAFLKSCSGEVCVSYRVGATTAAALAALAAAVATAPAAFAQEQRVVVAKSDPDDVVIITGGRIERVQDIPVAVVAIEDSAIDAPPAATKSQPPAKPAPKEAGAKPRSQ